jgi:hypothetical protein
MEKNLKKTKNPMAFPFHTIEFNEISGGREHEKYFGMTLMDYAQVHFMSAIISNADTMREITKTYNSAPKDKRVDFEELIAKISFSYADAMLKVRSDNE